MEDMLSKVKIKDVDIRVQVHSSVTYIHECIKSTYAGSKHLHNVYISLGMAI
jgi:hypothetical protein